MCFLSAWDSSVKQGNLSTHQTTQLSSFKYFGQFRTSIAIGFLLGVIFILSNQMLILFAFFVDRAHRKKNNSMSHSEAEKAFAAFSFMIFVIYTIFGIMLAVFRIEVIKQGEMIEEEVFIVPKNLFDKQ